MKCVVSPFQIYFIIVVHALLPIFRAMIFFTLQAQTRFKQVAAVFTPAFISRHSLPSSKRSDNSRSDHLDPISPSSCVYKALPAH